MTKERMQISTESERHPTEVISDVWRTREQQVIASGNE